MIRIGTRGSALALAQATLVADRFEDETELVAITTSGDTGATREDKSRWVSELERALLDDAIDVAVHSAKDVPAELAEGLELVAFPRRADPRDVICGAASLGELEPGSRVGTSSLRRAAQIKAVREDLEIVSVRGNVDTRLRKLDDGQADAIIVAAAGLRRLGLEQRIAFCLDPQVFVPEAGQGALAVQVRAGEEARVAAIDHPSSRRAVEAERERVAALGGGCNTPVAAHAWLEEGTLRLRSWMAG